MHKISHPTRHRAVGIAIRQSASPLGRQSSHSPFGSQNRHWEGSHPTRHSTVNIAIRQSTSPLEKQSSHSPSGSQSPTRHLAIIPFAIWQWAPHSQVSRHSIHYWTSSIPLAIKKHPICHWVVSYPTPIRLWVVNIPLTIAFGSC